MSNEEQFSFSFPEPEQGHRLEPAEHDKIVIGMFALVGNEEDGVVVKIESVDIKERKAQVRLGGEGGDTEWLSFGELKTLKTTPEVVSLWNGRGESRETERKAA